MIRKLLIVPYFGKLPPWYQLWRQNIMSLARHGYDVLEDRNEDGFAERVKRRLGVEWPSGDGRKLCDYRCAFGVLYAHEIEEGEYDFWGHTDTDIVYGRVERWVTDEFLGGLDLHSNHVNYLSGPWSLYRAEQEPLTHLFERHEDWRGYLENPETTGWVETAYTRLVDAAHDAGEIRRRYTMWQTRNLNDFSTVHWDESGALMEGDREVMMAHFRRTKQYPEGCR